MKFIRMAAVLMMASVTLCLEESAKEIDTDAPKDLVKKDGEDETKKEVVAEKVVEAEDEIDTDDN